MISFQPPIITNGHQESIPPIARRTTLNNGISLITHNYTREDNQSNDIFEMDVVSTIFIHFLFWRNIFRCDNLFSYYSKYLFAPIIYVIFLGIHCVKLPQYVISKIDV